MQTNESLLVFSAELKSAREAKDISLQEISSKTKIDMKFLKAIEVGDFDVLPDVYLKAFLKEYAKNVDLDPNQIIQKYDRAKMGKYSKDDEETAAIGEEAAKEETAPRRKFGASNNPPIIVPEIEEMRSGSSRNYLPIIAIVVIIIFLLSLIYIFFVKDRSSAIIKDDSAGQSFYEEVFEVEEPAAFTSSSDSINVKIVAEKNSSYRAILDGRNATEFNLQEGNTKTLRAREKVVLVLNNSGAAILYLNGSKVDFSPIDNQVKRLEITAAGIKQITDKEISANE